MKWSVRDRGLAEALTEYEAASCSSCGQRRELAWDPATSGFYEAHEVVCSGCSAIEERKKELKDPPPGIHFYTTLPDGFDIEKARTDRAEAMAAELAGRRG